MKKFLLLLAFVATIPFTLAHGAPAKYRVAVGELVVSDLVNPKQAKIVKESSLIADIENAIRNGRKFDLLSRRQETLTAIRNEQKFAQSGLAAKDAAFTGQLSNAQAIVQVEVLGFSFGRNASKVPHLENKYRVSDNCSIELAVQIVDTTKGTVLGAFPIKASSSSGTFVNNGIGGASRSILDKTMQKAAASLANQLSDTVYPITVITVKGNDIYINRGNDSGIKQGEIFEVFAPGEELIDPQTGENLGTTETLVGKVKVKKINPKVTIVRPLTSNLDVQAGYILRR